MNHPNFYNEKDIQTFLKSKVVRQTSCISNELAQPFLRKASDGLPVMSNINLVWVKLLFEK